MLPLSGSLSGHEETITQKTRCSNPLFAAAGRLDGSFDIVSTMDQRSMVIYLHLKGILVQVTYDDLVIIRYDEVLASRTMTRHL
jgi:hypothetical protein